MRSIRGIQARALAASEAFLGRPYALGTTGEGAPFSFDADPLWRLDEFDCTTFVEAVLAFGMVSPWSPEPVADLETRLREIKYVDGRVCFPGRNHFTELHWTRHLVNDLAILKDVTLDIDPQAPIRSKVISVADWYKAKHAEIDATFDSDWCKFVKHGELDAQSPNKAVGDVARLPYLSLDCLLDPEIQAKIKTYGMVLFNLIKGDKIALPNGTLIDATTTVGHQGFLVVKNERIYVRHASSLKTTRKILDIPFDEYVQERQKETTWPTLGMNLLALVPQD